MIAKHMAGSTLRRVAVGALAFPLLVLGAGFLTGCGLLDTSDPTAIEDADLSNATGADLMRRNAIGNLYRAIGDAAVQSGLLTDEFFSDPRPQNIQLGQLSSADVLDRRLSERLEEAGVSVYREWQDARQDANAAIEQLRAYAPPDPGRAYIGQMLTARGYIALWLADDFCGGFPFHEVVNSRVVYGAPLTTAAAYERALADFDSAVVYAADSARIADAARIGRARALLGLGRVAEAGAAVAVVPTPYLWNVEYTTASGIGSRNPLVFTYTSTNARSSVADREGGNGLDFVSANDPRVKTTRLGIAYDGVTEIRAIAKYPNQGAPMVLASGVEARLIEAEAALQAGGDWLGILNQLRADQITPALSALSDPGRSEARLDLLFRERAFWLFATGHRLSDLRRLVRVYGRHPDSVFPSGSYRLGGTYGTATNLIFSIAKEAALVPSVTGCIGG